MERGVFGAPLIVLFIVMLLLVIHTMAFLLLPLFLQPLLCDMIGV